jgi:hypothetical protein
VHLQALTNLEQSDLPGIQVTDAGLLHFKGLTGLQEPGHGATPAALGSPAAEE